MASGEPRARRETITSVASFAEVEAAERQRVVIEHARPALLMFFPFVAYIGVVEWITRPSHRLAAIIVGSLYVAIAAACLALLRRHPKQAVAIAEGGVSALTIAMLSYSPLVRGSGELCVMAISVLLGGFAVAFPLGLRSQLIVSLAPLIGYAGVLQLGTTTAYPAWYSASALIAFLVVLALGARASDHNRRRILADSLRHARLATENERLRDEAQAADRAKTDVMSMLSHELRAPLGNIRMLSELVLEQSTGDTGEVDAVLRRLSDQAKRASDLVHTMLEFGSIESGGLRLSLEEVELAEVLERVRDDLPAAWQRSSVQLFWHLPPRGLRIVTDRGKLEGIVRNLIHNALKHTKIGSVSVEVFVDELGNAARFAIADTGDGIAEEALPSIFDRFSRAVAGGDGFGLGLFIVKRFADALGGSVAVKSALEVGTRFEVTIPIAPLGDRGRRAA